MADDIRYTTYPSYRPYANYAPYASAVEEAAAMQKRHEMMNIDGTDVAENGQHEESSERQKSYGTYK
jgi:hypothetical protein